MFHVSESKISITNCPLVGHAHLPRQGTTAKRDGHTAYLRWRGGTGFISEGGVVMLGIFDQA